MIKYLFLLSIFCLSQKSRHLDRANYHWLFNYDSRGSSASAFRYLYFMRSFSYQAMEQRTATKFRWSVVILFCFSIASLGVIARIDFTPYHSC